MIIQSKAKAIYWIFSKSSFSHHITLFSPNLFSFATFKPGFHFVTCELWQICTVTSFIEIKKQYFQ